jgi:hypothetical protein
MLNGNRIGIGYSGTSDALVASSPTYSEQSHGVTIGFLCMDPRLWLGLSGRVQLSVAKRSAFAAYGES